QLGRRLGRRLALSDAAIAWLEDQPWPGNVRELAHAIERAAVLSDRETLEPEDLTRIPPLGAAERGPGIEDQGEGKGTLREAVEAAERAAFTAALERSGGNRRAAAERLGVSLRTLFYKMERLGIA
ncbi:MAG: helix-turn-helix domain-containing protein, partial [Dehalococcoidia bacterium]